MTDKDKPKPVTLADYIPPDPMPKSKGSAASKRDLDRLDALEREVRSDGATKAKRSGRKSGKKKSNFWTVVLYSVALVILLIIID